MAWTAPMTAVANTAFTADQFNTHVRDNLLETAPGKATTASNYFVATGPNAITQRSAQYQSIDNTESRTSTSFGDMTTPGPTITVNTGTKALVIWGANMRCDTASQFAIMGVTVSGATLISASDTRSVAFQQTATDTGQITQMCWTELYTLNPGSNTFTCKYRTTAGTSIFSRRRLTVIPF